MLKASHPFVIGAHPGLLQLTGRNVYAKISLNYRGEVYSRERRKNKDYQSTSANRRSG